MNPNDKETMLYANHITPLSGHLLTRARPSRRGLAALSAAIGLAASPAIAGVEFVTDVGQCTKVDTIGDGKDLRIIAGTGTTQDPSGGPTRFEVWGSGIDVNPSVRVTASDSNPGTVTARIVSVRNGPQNASGPCKLATGSALVEVTAPPSSTVDLRRSLRFRMPLGDESPLAVSVLAYRTPVFTWAAQPTNDTSCLLKGMGTVRLDLNNERLTLSLPPGAGADTSNCTLQLRGEIRAPTSVMPDLRKQYTYSFSGLPSWLSVNSGTGRSQNSSPAGTATPQMSADVLQLRRLTAVQTSQIVATAPNGRRDTVTLVVNPPPPNGFTQPVACGINRQVKAGEIFNCEVRLAVTPPAAGQLITYHIPSSSCFEPGASGMSYSATTGEGTVTLPGTATIHQIPFRAKAGAGCATVGTGIGHTLKFWIGNRGNESGPLFSQANVTMNP